MKTPDWKDRSEGPRTVAELVMEAYFARESCKTDTFYSAAVIARKRVRNRWASTSSISNQFSDTEDLIDLTSSDSD